MILLTSETCAPCKVVKTGIEKMGIKDDINYVDITSPNGRTLVQKHNIKSVPVLIATGGIVTGLNPILFALRQFKEEK